MENMNRELLDYIAEVTSSPLDAQLSFFNENVDKHPKEMISCVRGLAEATVTYLYYVTAGTNAIPGPYWCLIFKSNEYRCFADECDKNKKKGYTYPMDYQKMWEANQLLKSTVPDTFIEEANSVKKLGNMVLHNNPKLANLDLPREAKKCLDSYHYILSEVNGIVNKKAKPDRKPDPNPEADHFPKNVVSEDKKKFATFDVKKWFAGVQAELARERAKTQEDYDAEDDNF